MDRQRFFFRPVSVALAYIFWNNGGMPLCLPHAFNILVRENLPDCSAASDSDPSSRNGCVARY